MGIYSQLKNKGQSSVEYLLLFLVVASMISFIFKSELFQNLFGDEGRFAKTYKNQMEFTYRNALFGSEEFSTPNYRSSRHPSYNGRFFGSAEAYPKQ